MLAAPDLVRLGGFRSVYSKVCQYFENEKLRVAFSFHPLLIGGNPFSTTAYYCLISHLERMHGVHFAMGGTGAIVNALARLASRVGATFRYEAEVERINVEEGRATGVDAEERRDHRLRHRRVERRRRLHLQQAPVACEAPALDEREARAGALFHEPVRLVLRHQPQVRGRVPPHDGAGPALSGALAGHLRAQASRRRFQPLPASPDDDRSLACSRRLRRVLRAGAGAPSGQRHGLDADGRTVPRAHREASRGNRDAGPLGLGRDLARSDAARLQGPASVREGRGLFVRAAIVPERLVPAAQQERGGVRAFISWGPARIRAQACRA